VRAGKVVTRDVPLGDGRTLRVGLVLDPQGRGDALLLAVGTGEGRGWREDPAQGLTLPASALQGLTKALGALRDA